MQAAGKLPPGVYCPSRRTELPVAQVNRSCRRLKLRQWVSKNKPQESTGRCSLGLKMPGCEWAFMVRHTTGGEQPFRMIDSVVHSEDSSTVLSQQDGSAGKGACPASLVTWVQFPDSVVGRELTPKSHPCVPTLAHRTHAYTWLKNNKNKNTSMGNQSCFGLGMRLSWQERLLGRHKLWIWSTAPTNRARWYTAKFLALRGSGDQSQSQSAQLDTRDWWINLGKGERSWGLILWL